MATDAEDSPYSKEEQSMVAEIEQGPMKAELKWLDKRKSDKGKTYYTETKDDEDTPEQTNWWEKYALCLTRHMTDDGKLVRRTSLQVNSDHLKALLRTHIGSYPGVTFETKKISIDAPYRVLFHYRNELAEASKKFGEESEAARHLKLLLSFVRETFAEEIDQHTSLLEQGLMSYDLLWTIFKPGTMVFATKLGQKRAFKLQSSSYSGGTCPGFDLSTTYIDFDGDDFGTREEELRVPPFVGPAPISALEVVPAHMHKNQDSIRKSLLARGAMFQRYAGVHFATYSGIGLDMSGYSIKRVSVDGRVVIDCKTFNRLNPNSEFGVEPLSSKTNASELEERRFVGNNETKVAFTALTTEQILMTSGLIRGFSFTEKRWLDFDVEKLAHIKWNDKCFEQLVLPTSHKNIVRALVSDHSKRNNFDDIVEGKGKGLVMVLHGPPGVGKTLTAEVVSEYTKKPLYIVSSGDLGTDSSSLDTKLSRILDMASTWKVVLLIDEADVFLEARSQHDLERNALVSIFLRVLEYYSGILFLTTNRVDSFDDAFKSRIHVPLKYSDLNTDSRRAIWRNFLSKVEDVDVDEDGYDSLSQAQLNGRQIKNVIRTASSLASYGSQRLDVAMLQEVIAIQLEFERDLDSQRTANGAKKAAISDETNGQMETHGAH